jgi:hypothetical protein
MAKKKTKKGCKLGRMNVGLIAVAIAMVALIGNYALAGTSIRQEIVNLVAEKLLVKLDLGEDEMLGTSTDWTDFTAVRIAEDLVVGALTTLTGTVTFSGSSTMTGTTTVQDMSYGSNYYEALTFTAGATTTPGGLFSIQNTGATKLCRIVEVDVSSGSSAGGLAGAGGPLDFCVGTSTSATAWSGAGCSLVATTTLATSTTSIINNVVNPGTYVGGDQDIGGAPFIWGNGVYLSGAFDSLSTFAATSSDVYTSMAGGIYITCHTR